MDKNNRTPNLSFSKYCEDLGIRPIKQDKVVLKIIAQSKTDYINLNRTHKEFSQIFVIGESYPEYCNDGQKLVIKNLKNNKYSVIAEIDLHGQTSNQAINSIKHFLNSHHTPNKTCLKIIHGKGHHSENNQVILKNLVRKYLENYSRLLAYSTGNSFNGGDGVTLIKLKH